MANIKSQIKRIRTSERQQERNKAGRSELKTRIANFGKAEESSDKKAAKEALDVAVKTLDRAASRGFIHKNNAANRKSALTKRFNGLS